MTNVVRAKSLRTVTLNQDEIQAGCKMLVEQKYNLKLASDDPVTGVQLRLVANEHAPGTSRLEADIEIA